MHFNIIQQLGLIALAGHWLLRAWHDTSLITAPARLVRWVRRRFKQDTEWWAALSQCYSAEGLTAWAAGNIRVPMWQVKLLTCEICHAGWLSILLTSSMWCDELRLFFLTPWQSAVNALIVALAPAGAMLWLRNKYPSSYQELPAFIPDEPEPPGVVHEDERSPAAKSTPRRLVSRNKNDDMVEFIRRFTKTGKLVREMPVEFNELGVAITAFLGATKDPETPALLEPIARVAAYKREAYRAELAALLEKDPNCPQCVRGDVMRAYALQIVHALDEHNRTTTPT